MSFTLLTSAASTSELRVTSAVAENFRPAYDILVRPRDSFTEIERQQNLVQQNYLSGIFGGITFEQYREIRSLPGVEVAAPIANIGYILPLDAIKVDIGPYLSSDKRQLYRLRLSWSANSGASAFPAGSHYVYYTPNPFKELANGFVGEVLPDHTTPAACKSFYDSRPIGSGSPFQLAAKTGVSCFSAATPELYWPVLDKARFAPGEVGATTDVFFPVFISAIDPVQESRLVGIDDAIVDGRMLRPNEPPSIQRKAENARWRVVPFVASTRTYVDEVLQVEVERLDAPMGRALSRELYANSDVYRFMTKLAGAVVGRQSIPIDPVYGRFVRNLMVPVGDLAINYTAYWSTAPVTYRSSGADRLEAVPTRNSIDTFRGIGGYAPGWAPLEERDTQYRHLSPYDSEPRFTGSNLLSTPALQVVGLFDPAQLPGFSEFSEVPLETYYPPTVEPADAASRRALSGKPLLPTQNIGGYIAQPPLMLTTLQGLRAFMNPTSFEDVDPSAPISVIRIRVSGVTGADPLSRERIRNVAQAIHQRTGLAVDITAGSSPHPLLVELPAGKFGQPPLLVREGWVEKGVAVRFLDAVDKKSLALFALILVICGFFLANGSLASVRSRRTEIGTLMCLGWSQAKVFASVLGEVALIGLAAGLAGTALAALLVPALSLRMPVLRTLLVVPVAVGLSALAGIVPAWRAARSRPLDAIRPAVSEVASARSVHRIVSMALANLRRMPSRTALAAGGLFVGVSALTLLFAINRAFQGVLVGTLLGNFVSLQVRGVDFLTIALTIALGGLSVADVVYLNLKERAPELVTLRTVGWRDAHLRRLVVTEGIAMGAFGSLLGVALGVGIASLVRGIPVSSILIAALVAGGAGAAVSGLAALVPLVAIQRATPPAVLAEE